MTTNRQKLSPKSADTQAVYAARLEAMSDEQLLEECQKKIWLSAYAANNRGSDYHWQCDACHQACTDRDKREIYSRAHKLVSEQ